MHWILGAGIHYNVKSHLVSISQKEYIRNLASKFNIQNAKLVGSPLLVGINFATITHSNFEEEKQEVENIPYHELIGSLMFTAIVLHPDITFSVNKLVQFTVAQKTISMFPDFNIIAL